MFLWNFDKRILLNGLPPVLVFKKEKEHLLPLPQDKVCSSYKLSSLKVKVKSQYGFMGLDIDLLVRALYIS